MLEEEVGVFALEAKAEEIGEGWSLVHEVDDTTVMQSRVSTSVALTIGGD